MPYSSLISNEDIEKIYKSHVDVNQIEISSESHTNIKHVNITSICTINNINILANTLRIRYLKNHNLNTQKDTAGKIVKYAFVELKENERGKQYITTFEKKASEIYFDNDFMEIQLDAAWDGIIVWPKLGYSYCHKEKAEEIIWQLWRTYLFGTDDEVVEDRFTIINNYIHFDDIPNTYKIGLGKWLRKNNINCTVPMYKAIL